MVKKKEAALSPEERLQQALVPKEEWPYALPEGWRWVRWGSVGKFTAGSAFKNAYQGHKEFDIPFYKVGSLKYTDGNGYLYDDSNTINEELNQKIRATIIPKNSLIFAKIGEAIRLNRRSINAVPCCIDNNLMSFTPIEEINLLYLYYWSKGFDLYQFTNATTVPAIRKSDLELIPFPLAPMETQTRIASILKKEFTNLDEAQEQIQSVIDSAEERKQSILHKAFTGELTGLKASNFRKLHIKDVVREFKYGTSEKSSYENKGIPVLRIPNIGDESILLNDLKYLSTSDVSLNDQLREGDILIIRSNGSKELVGKSAVVHNLDSIYTYASFLIRIRVTDEILPDYLNLFLNSSDARSQMFSMAKSSAGINNINSKELGAVKIPVPDCDAQNKIVEAVNMFIFKNGQITECALSSIDRLAETKQSILNMAFSGKLIR